MTTTTGTLRRFFTNFDILEIYLRCISGEAAPRLRREELDEEELDEVEIHGVIINVVIISRNHALVKEE